MSVYYCTVLVSFHITKDDELVGKAVKTAKIGATSRSSAISEMKSNTRTAYRASKNKPGSVILRRVDGSDKQVAFDYIKLSNPTAVKVS